MTATIKPRQVLLDGPEQAHAREVLHDIGGDSYSMTMVGSDNRQVVVPPDLTQIIRAVVAAVAAGDKISITQLPDNLTTTVAADVLGVSRQAVMKMIQRGELPSHKAGTHHRVRRDDVLELKRVRRERQRQAFAALRELDEAFESF